MALNIRRVEYYYTSVHDRPGEAYRLLSRLAGEEVNLLVFSAVPMGTANTQLVLFPENVDRMMRAAEKAGLSLTGPQHALLIQGDDELGALADIHGRLYDAHVNVYASHGVTDGQGCFGYVLYVAEDDFEKAATSLGI
jgi:hypothetical protein